MTQKYLLTFSTSNLKLKFLGVIAICLFTLFAITSCGGVKDRKKSLTLQMLKWKATIKILYLL